MIRDRSIRRGFVDGADGQLHFYTCGAGRPVILLHSTPNAQLFVHVLPLLGARYQVISLDTPGYGDSERPPRPYTTVAEFAARIIELADGLGLDRFHLVGHMTGAPIALEVAAAHPGRIDRLILSELVDWSASRLQSEHHIDEPFAEPVADGTHLIQIWNRYRDMVGKVPIEEIQRRFYTVFQSDFAGPQSGGETYGAAGWPGAAPYAIEHYDCWARAPLVTAPTLILCGTGGKLRSGGDPLADQPRFVSAIPDARAGQLEGLNHTAPLVAPERFSQAVAGFLGG